jgi:hypothetical protein
MVEVAGSLLLATTPPLPILVALATASATGLASSSATGLASSSHPATSTASASEQRSASVPSAPHPILSGCGGACLGDPVGSWHFLAWSFASSLEDTARPLLATGLASHPVSLSEDHLHDPVVSILCGVDRVHRPEGHALLVHLRHAQPRVSDGESTEAASEQEVFVVIPALGQGLLDLILEPRVRPVGSMLGIRAAARVHVPRQWCEKQHQSACQEGEEGEAVLEEHI